MYNLNMETVQVKRITEEQVIEYLTERLRRLPDVHTNVIMLIGGPASGKTMLAERLAERLGNTAVLATDNYVVGDRAWRREHVEDVGKDPVLKYDPRYLNEQVKQIQAMSDGDELGIPKYDGETGVSISADPQIKPDQSEYATRVKGKQDFIIVEGDFQFLEHDLIDVMIYLDVDDDVRLENRLFRDSQHRKEHEDPEVNRQKIRDNFAGRQKTQFQPHTLPQKEKADIVIKVHAVQVAERNAERAFTYAYDVLEKASA